MNVASLELCRELYELSGWDSEKELRYMHYYFSGHGFGYGFSASSFSVGVRRELQKAPTGIELKEGHIPEPPEHRIDYFVAPAYDLGYLLRKLQSIQCHVFPNDEGVWLAHGGKEKFSDPRAFILTAKKADTPENAVAQLAIELFKKGVLSHD
jgi:hypothetical protein